MMINEGEFLRIALTENVGGFSVSTAHPKGASAPETCVFKVSPWETPCLSVRSAVVETYASYEEAARGHEHYVKLVMSGLGRELLARRGVVCQANTSI